MLVLSRKLNETIIIGGNIRIKVVGIHGNQLRLGIEAPDDVRVMREELLLRAANVAEVPLAPGRSNPRRSSVAATSAR